MTRTIYAIGDVHGDLEQLLEAHRRIDTDRASGVKDHMVVYVGDLVDRRPDSKSVLDYVIESVGRGDPVVTLKGNHDRLFQWFLEDATRRDPVLRSDYTWLHPRMGGRDTLRSYGLDVPEDYDVVALQNEALNKVPQAHRDFLEKMPISFEAGDYFFAHAGIKPEVPLSQQTEDDLIWIRDEFLDYPGSHSKIVVHGHTPVEEATHYGNRINVDTGAAWGRKLSTVVIEGSDVFLLEVDGRKRIKTGHI